MSGAKKLEADRGIRGVEEVVCTVPGLRSDRVKDGDPIPKPSSNDPSSHESGYDDFYERYEDCPEGLPEDTSLDAFSCSPGNFVLPPASVACEESESDSDLVEALIGIMPQCLYFSGITEADYLKALPHLAVDEAAQGQTELELLFAPALVLLGKGWQSKLKRISGYSQGHLQQVFSGKRAVTAELKAAVLKAYRAEIIRCEERASRGMAGMIKILEAR